jgi:hypothetical protein
VASLVEKESANPEERPVIASVIYNRIRADMPLQIDATVQYAIGEPKEDLSLADLEVQSPYNTYENPGLPPGPIASPSRESLEAALNPAQTGHLYYVLEADGKSTSSPTTTRSSWTGNKSEKRRSRDDGSVEGRHGAGRIRQSLEPAPPIRTMERLSDANARMRKLKRDWTADLFTKRGQFWEQIRARRDSFGITPRTQVPRRERCSCNRHKSRRNESHSCRER